MGMAATSFERFVTVLYEDPELLAALLFDVRKRCDIPTLSLVLAFE